MSKRWELIQTDAAAVHNLQLALGIHPMLCTVLVQRGIRTFEKARQFFRYSMADAHDPFLMRDMELAVNRILLAISKGEKIMAYGDYDVDGTSGVALFLRFLKKLSAKTDYYIPDRHTEGYGVSEKGVRHAHAEGFHLIVTIDCGIKASAPIALARELGMDVVVCDHHQVDSEQLPPATAVLNPLQPGCNYPFKGLSGAGVVFKLCQALAVRMDLSDSSTTDLLDLLALSLSCDIVPLTGENRMLTAEGLKQINRNPSVGLKALLQQSGRKPPLEASDLIFGLGPLINAAGRLGHARDAVKLLSNEDEPSAHDQARFLAHQNRRRRIMDAEARELALRQWETNQSEGNAPRKTVVLYNPSWHQGILGILAARLAEELHRPVVVFTDSEKGITGSARSIPELDFYPSLEDCSDLFTAFGGHSHAAGIRMVRENIADFTTRFEAAITQRWVAKMPEGIIEIAGNLALNAITPQFMAVYKQLAPHGPGNMRPIFMAKNMRFYRNPNYLRDGHVQFSVVQEGNPEPWSVIGFGLAAKVKALQGKPFELCFTIKEDFWKGQKRLKLEAKDLREG